MDHYVISRCIGRGSYGSVYLVRDKQDGKHYVLKKIDMQHVNAKVQHWQIGKLTSHELRQERRAAEQEVELLAGLQHPNIVTYKESFMNRENELCIIMNFCEGGDLYTKIKKQDGKYFSEKVCLIAR